MQNADDTHEIPLSEFTRDTAGSGMSDQTDPSHRSTSDVAFDATC